MNKFRREKLSSVLESEISRLLIKEFDFEELITLTAVQIGADFNKAVAWIGVYPSAEKEKIINKLNKEASRLQYLLVKRLRMKWVPKISFKFDELLDRDALIEKKLIAANNNES